MQKVTKNPDSYRDKAAAIAPRAQPCQRTGNSLVEWGLALGVEALSCLGMVREGVRALDSAWLSLLS